jgi:polysaccharide export outer membrane protein
MSDLKSFSLLVAWLCLLPLSSAFAQERTIKPGDVIEIVVAGHEELNRSVLVSTQGKIDYPFLEGVPVDGLTLSRLRDLLMHQLSQSLETPPFIEVRFAENYPMAITVLGSVAKPGVYMLHNPAALQSANGEAGGFAAGAQLPQIKLVRKDGKSGSFDVAFRMSLLDVIALAGGATDQANLSKVKVLSFAGQNAGKTRVVNINGLLQASRLKSISVVAPGDVVYVPKSKNHLGKFFGVLRDLSAFATLYILIRSERR